jgi:subtilase family serine protease
MREADPGTPSSSIQGDLPARPGVHCRASKEQGGRGKRHACSAGCQNDANKREGAMKPSTRLRGFPFVIACAVVVALAAGSALAAAPSAGAVLGPEDQNKQISVTVWLKLHSQAQLDEMVREMYDKSSANYHQFLTWDQYQAQFAPSAADAAQVKSFLAAHNLKVTATDPMNHFVVAHGRVGDAQSAFNTQINRAMVNGAVHRVTASEPTVSGAASALVSAVQGLSDLAYRANVGPAIDPESGTAYAGIPVSAGPGPNGLFFSAQCLRPPELVTFTTNGGTPKATYFGNRYGQDITSGPPNLSPCGYDAAELQAAYGLNSLYGKGLDGTGQTIMIVDAFGSNTIQADANLFSALNGLPQLTASNFQIFTPNGSATCTSTNGCITGNWQFETTLDVEWAHSIAPGANIVLVLGADNSFTNLDIANLYAIENGFGNVLSNSFGIPEIALVELLPSELVVENGISEIAAALGISHDISTGDSGDNLAVDNADFGINSVSAGANADSPFATAVGGTSTFLDSHQNIRLQTGWGLNFQRIADPTPNPPVIPPLAFGFQQGSGGGASAVYAKPRYQRRLPGSFRQTPDIAMNADPQTGVEIIVTPDSVPGDPQFVEVFGGTSLSCPMFSAFWAIANQAYAQAGGGSLGQAAPLLYALPPAAIRDVNVTPLDTLFNVSGVITAPPAPPQFLSANALAAPLDGTKLYVSALFQSASSTRWDVFTFGTDSSLTTGPGWDNVTGLGTPNGAQFVSAVVAAASR